MTYYATLSGVIAATPPTKEPVATPVLLAAASASATQSNIATSAATVAENDFLCALIGTRAGSDGVDRHRSLTATEWSATFDRRANLGQYDDRARTYIRGSIWTAVASRGGTGVLTANMDQRTWQQACILLKLPGVVAYQTHAQSGNQRGGAVSVAWPSGPRPPAPAADGITIAFLLKEGTGGTPTLADDFTPIPAAGGNASQFEWEVWYKLGAPVDPLAFSGAVRDRARIGMGMQGVGA